MTTAFMNNGEDTWMFTIVGESAEVLKINLAGVITKEHDIANRQQAREFWATAFRVAPMSRGSLIPSACIIYPEYAYVQDEADEPLPFGTH